MTAPEPQAPDGGKQVATWCNLCGATDFHRRGDRHHAMCMGCGAVERTRLLWLVLEPRVRPGMRVLHLAPEAPLAPRLRAMLGDGYDPVDLTPADYPHVPGVRAFDLVGDAARLPAERYDLILHSHVMEHVTGNVTAVLFHLHRALKADGAQICCIPVLRDRHYEEDLAPLTADDANLRFGQFDHVRRFGEQDVQRTLGMVFALPDPFALPGRLDGAALRRHGIPAGVATRWSAHSVLCLEKRDLLLR